MSRRARSTKAIDRDDVPKGVGAERGAAQEPGCVLTVDEVARVLRVNRKSVYHLIGRGEIPGVRRLGRSVRVHRETLLAWLAQGRGHPLSPRSP